MEGGGEMNSVSNQTGGSMFPYEKEGAVYDVLDIAQLDDALDCVSEARYLTHGACRCLPLLKSDIPSVCLL